MTNFTKQTFSVLAAGAMLLNVATPALAGTIEISGNGSGSDNKVIVESNNKTTVNQNNTANVTNNVTTKADTGDNKANYNTGGDVYVNTGKADVTANVSNDLNKNIAEVDCCAAGGADVTVKKNGSDSDNKVGLVNENKTTVNQKNTANVTNNVGVDAQTGNNKAGENTGGEVHINTGKAFANVDVTTQANTNIARIGSGNSATPTPSASFVIIGNGSGSDNEIAAALTNDTRLSQNNAANITNNVGADAETGDNKANYNTGGDVYINAGMGGDSTVTVGVDNAVNFNAADVDCGCEYDVTAEISGNGANAGDKDHKWWKNWWDKDENYIGLTLDNTQTVGQGNTANLTNNVEADADAGNNEAGYNVGEGEYSDPSITTGNVVSDTTVSNSGNENILGDFSFDMPEMPNLEFSFSWAAFFATFGMSN